MFRANRGPNENGEYCKCNRAEMNGGIYEAKWCTLD